MTVELALALAKTEIYVESGQVLTLQALSPVSVKLSETGVPGPQGLSPYQLAVAAGFEGTESQWLASLKGDQGDKGDPGQGIALGGAIGQVLAKADTPDFATDWLTLGEMALKSIAQTEAMISQAINALINSAPDTLDTLSELAAALQANGGLLAEAMQEVNKRVRYDVAQLLSEAQALQARLNIGAAPASAGLPDPTGKGGYAPRVVSDGSGYSLASPQEQRTGLGAGVSDSVGIIAYGGVFTGDLNALGVTIPVTVPTEFSLGAGATNQPGNSAIGDLLRVWPRPNSGPVQMLFSSTSASWQYVRKHNGTAWEWWSNAWDALYISGLHARSDSPSRGIGASDTASYPGFFRIPANDATNPFGASEALCIRILGSGSATGCVIAVSQDATPRFAMVTRTGGVWGSWRMLGDMAYKVSTDYQNINNDYMPGHAPEGKKLLAAHLLNDFANARLRGAILTQNTLGLSNAEIDALFDGKGTYVARTPSAVSWPAIIEFTLPRALTYSCMIGISFGNESWRCRSVKIEAFTNGAWVTIYNTTTNAGSEILAQVTGNNDLGTTSVRYTLSDPYGTGGGSFRMLHLWGFNYNSDMWSQVMMPRAGGDMLGPLNLKPLGTGGAAWTFDEASGDFVIKRNGTNVMRLRPDGTPSFPAQPTIGNTYVQQTRPTAAGPWTWWETNASGEIIDLTINTGV